MLHDAIRHPFLHSKVNHYLMTVEDYQSGQVLLIDKPLHWTSFQVVNKLRWHIRQKFGIKKIKVGHAGTLDPLASGLLIICTGKFTKQINEYLHSNFLMIIMSGNN